MSSDNETRGELERLRAFEGISAGDEKMHLHVVEQGEEPEFFFIKSSFMLLIPIQVECNAGAEANKTPRRFTWEDKPVDVQEILDRWYQTESRPEWPRADYFKVRGMDAHDYLLKHDLEADEWYLGKQW